MADQEKIANIKRSIEDWQARLDAGSTGLNPEVVSEIISKLQADLAAAETE